jgi:hypothetical protein
MSDLVILGQALGSGFAVGVTVCTGCYLAGHPGEIAASWATGREWLTVRRYDLAERAHVAWLWLLVHTLRAHGRHRRAVTA